MIKLAQTPPERIAEVKRFLKKTKDFHEKDRARAIVKLFEGKQRKVVADFLEVNIATVDEWQRRFRRHGIDGLRTKPQKGNRHLLTREQKNEVKKSLAKAENEVAEIRKLLANYVADWVFTE